MLTSILAAFVIELAKSGGHELGIKILAGIGPHLPIETVVKAWHALVAAAQRRSAEDSPEVLHAMLAGLAQGTGGDGGPRGPG